MAINIVICLDMLINRVLGQMATYVEEGEQMVINSDILGTGNKPVEREMGVNILKKERKKRNTRIS